jgi:hypothetical protein
MGLPCGLGDYRVSWWEGADFQERLPSRGRYGPVP